MPEVPDDVAHYIQLEGERDYRCTYSETTLYPIGCAAVESPSPERLTYHG